ncbi:glycosyltransferase [Virgibacillus byunsanensis]|uniref:Glycosyltransferase n=1 Tax=Virgibacillus byunsanensis TaxID=570945 RepID=A0ABW3LTE9_9BACI
MKKKILFMVINMNIGGTEKALLNMVAEMPEDEYDITILMLEKYGGFLDSIPSKVHVEYLQEYSKIKEKLNKPPKKVAMSFIKKGKLIKGFEFSFIVLLSKLTKNKCIFFKYLLRDIPEFENEYDVAIAYAGPMDFISYFISAKIEATKRIQWIHFDTTKIGFSVDFAKRIYKQFDKLFVVSEEANNKLIEFVPKLKGKTEVFLNMISPKLIYSQSKEGKGFDDEFNGLRILTVGRLKAEKGQDMAIRALSRIIKDGYQVKWYCLGEGSSRSEFEQLIKEYNLQGKFVLLGTDINPYPYIAQCDLYVQPSRYEGYCITLSEARCLGKPIVTTNVNGAIEQIQNGRTGLIVDIDENAIFYGLKKMLDDKYLRQKFSENLSKEYVGTKSELDKLYQITNLV